MVSKVGGGSSRSQEGRGASCTALRKPSPPYFTGRDAWVHAEVLGSKLMLVMAPTMDLSLSSDNARLGERKQGEVLRVYRSFGMAKEWQSRRMAIIYGRQGVEVSLL